MKKAVLILLAFAGSTFAIHAYNYPAAVEAQSSTVNQNRFYPRWSGGETLSKAFYKSGHKLYKPNKQEEEYWASVAYPFLVDLFELNPGGQARIYTPATLIHPLIIQDGRAYFETFWADKTNRERHIADLEILGLSETPKWTEVWVRFVVRGRHPNLVYTHYASMMIEAPWGQPPYLADFKVLGRTSAGSNNEILLERIIGLGDYGSRPKKEKPKAMPMPHIPTPPPYAQQQPPYQSGYQNPYAAQQGYPPAQAGYPHTQQGYNPYGYQAYQPQSYGGYYPYPYQTSQNYQPYQGYQPTETRSSSVSEKLRYTNKLGPKAR